MSDNKSKQEGRDKSKISGEEDYEVSYMAEKMKVSKERVLDALKAVGNNREKVMEYLSKK